MGFWKKMIRGKARAAASEEQPPIAPTPDHVPSAARNGDLETVEAVLAQDPTLLHSQVVRDMRREMKEAIENGDVSKASALLKEDPDLAAGLIDTTETALYCAVRVGHKEIVKLLLAGKADVNMASGWGPEGPLRLAVRQDQKDLVELLLANGATLDAIIATEFLLHCVKSEQIARLLLARGANVNATDIRTTPLHRAAERGDLPLVELFVANGASVDPEDSQGYTPLYLAAYRRHIDVVTFLLSHGADINHKDNEGATPLLRVFGTQWDQVGDSLSGAEMLRFLEEHGGHT